MSKNNYTISLKALKKHLPKRAKVRIFKGNELMEDRPNDISHEAPFIEVSIPRPLLGEPTFTTMQQNQHKEVTGEALEKTLTFGQDLYYLLLKPKTRIKQ